MSSKRASKQRAKREYVVEKIVAKRQVSGAEYYLLKWEGYPDSMNTWEPRSNLAGCQEFLSEFEEQFRIHHRSEPHHAESQENLLPNKVPTRSREVAQLPQPTVETDPKPDSGKPAPAEPALSDPTHHAKRQLSVSKTVQPLETGEHFVKSSEPPEQLRAKIPMLPRPEQQETQTLPQQQQFSEMPQELNPQTSAVTPHQEAEQPDQDIEQPRLQEETGEQQLSDKPQCSIAHIADVHDYTISHKHEQQLDELQEQEKPQASEKQAQKSHAPRKRLSHLHDNLQASEQVQDGHDEGEEHHTAKSNKKQESVRKRLLRDKSNKQSPYKLAKKSPQKSEAKPKNEQHQREPKLRVYRSPKQHSTESPKPFIDLSSDARLTPSKTQTTPQPGPCSKRPKVKPRGTPVPSKPEYKTVPNTQLQYTLEPIKILGVRLGEHSNYEYAVQMRKSDDQRLVLSCCSSDYLAEKCPAIIIGYLEQHMAMKNDTILHKSLSVAP